METEEVFNKQIVMEKEGLKLTKNSRGYNWEIKIIEINVDRLDEINEKMKGIYGGEE